MKRYTIYPNEFFQESAMSTEIYAMRPSQQQNSCRFCTFLGDADNQHPANRPWHSHDGYAALASFGALVPGWSLICPRSHAINLAQHYLRTDFWEFAHDIAQRLSLRYQKPIQFFEHGPQMRGSRTGCGTDHAHLHAVPLDFSVGQEASAWGELTWVKCKAVEICDITKGREYLFAVTKFNGTESEGQIAILDAEISQFFRMVIARKLQIEDRYDYKQFPMLDVVEATVEDMRANAPQPQLHAIGA